jgi:CBS-domain-containing membrane protein
MLKNGIKFLLHHEQVIQIGVQSTDQHYAALIRYAGLSARDVEEVLKDFSEQIDVERANMNQVHRILNKKGG